MPDPYAGGGALLPGLSTVTNTSGRAERVLTAAEWSAMNDDQQQPPERPVPRADDYEAPGPDDADQGAPGDGEQDGDR